MPPKRINKRPGQKKPMVPIVEHFKSIDQKFRERFPATGKRNGAVKTLEISLSPNLKMRKRVNKKQVSAAIRYLEEYVPAALKLNGEKRKALRQIRASGQPVPVLREKIAEQVEKNLNNTADLVEAVKMTSSRNI